MSNPQILVLFLKALMAAKKSVGLYPVGSDMSNAWIQRLHASRDGFVQQGLSFPLRVGRDRFLWAGEDLLTIDPTLEALRFDLESRGIADFSIDPAVGDWELRAFLELLNQPPASLTSLAGAPEYLRARGVLHVSVGTPSGAAGDEGAADASAQVLREGKDSLDLFVDAVLELTEERFADLTYDRMGLTGWLEAVADGDQVDVLYSALKMLGGMAEGGGDREIRTRTMIEATLLLPELTLRSLLTKWLIPLAGSDLIAFNLLTQITEDELQEIARLVPQEQLLSLSSELLEFPWEQGKRQRLLEAITLTVQRRAEPSPAGAPAALLTRDDPRLVSLRQEIAAACHPDVLLERSADILLALIFNVESEEYPGFAVDAIEEIVGEALARGKLDLAVRVLSTLSASSQLGGQQMREHSRRLAIFRRRVAGRTQISLVAGGLRQNVSSEQMQLAAEYLRLVTREGVEEFTGLLADERDRRVRARMCQVLANVGASIIPAMLPWIEDARWYVARNVLYILGRIGHESTFTSVMGVLDHPHPRVRMEAVRALGLIGGGLAVGPLLRAVTDVDPTVQVAVLKTLGSLRQDEAVPTLRDLAGAPVRSPVELEIRQEAINALVALGSPLALAALVKLSGRRPWFWQRKEKRIRAMAMTALSASRAAAAGALEGEDAE